MPLLIVLALSASCAVRHRESPPSVLFIIVDTLRADHLGCYGYRQIHTPHIDALASSGVRFRHIVTAAPVTAPSVASVLTSTYPIFNGVRDNQLFVMDSSLPNLATVLGRAGYRTAAFVGSVILNSKYGFAEGFEHYDDDMSAEFVVYSPLYATQRDQLQGTQRRAEDVTEAALEWLKDNGRKAPFLCLVHYFDPHLFYDPPPPFSERYSASPYDGEVAYTDSQVGALLDGLKELGLEKSTLVVFTSDHGEGLGDHGEGSHGFFLYDATAMVPLVFRLPAVLPAGVTISAQGRTVDIMPTIVELIGLTAPETAQGVSLAPAMLAAEPLEPRDAYIETFHTLYSYNWHELQAMRTPQWKYVRAPEPELYDLQADPDELTNLASKRPDVVSRMEKALVEMEERLSAGAAPYRASRSVPDPAMTAKMRTLGYVGAPSRRAKTTPKPGGDLPDPKAKVREWNARQEARGCLRTALALQHKGDYDGAFHMIAAAESLAPHYAEVFAIHGLIMKRSGDVDEGIKLMERAVEMGPRSEMVHQTLNNLGLAYLEKDRCEDGIEAFERSLRIKPDYYKSLYNLAYAYERCGSPAKAAETYDEYLKRDPRLDAATAASLRKKIAGLRSAARGP